MLCARCRAPIAEGARFCKHCGAKAAAENAAAGASICPNCQTPLPLNMKFCRHCGASLTALKRPAADGDSVPVVPLAPDDARAGGKKF
ncbi:MAG: zinc ribbon domain-containing protein, partial [Zoogloeaceae bacterium]|nr:zinc ribbon domain-containing protein [Zoogloeaceae bacterium]